ncbi:uncharacterized protein LOC128388607 [Panonychus citri]|uniref:uncharacterized protein LOC128388607 n=1 Tax=Panonychus citri TaxID=50023 RepID=UPI0023077C15|nr:uncharacterized protein LOC128388607 [Panonychus citri]
MSSPDDGLSDQNQYPVESTNMKLVKVVPLPHARSEVWAYFGFIAGDDGEIQDKKKVVCKLCATTLSYSGNTTNLFTHLKALHPEANPSKMTPTSKPIRGKKGKFKFIGFSTGDSVENENQEYIVRGITFGDSSSMPITFVAEDETPNTSGGDGEHPTEMNTQEDYVLSTSTGLSSTMETTTEVETSNDISPENIPLLSCDDITNAIVNMLVEDCRPICLTQGKGFTALIKFLAPGYKIPEELKLKSLVKKRHKEIQRTLILRGLDDE